MMKPKIGVGSTFALLLIVNVSCAPSTSTTESLVVSSPDSPKESSTFEKKESVLVEPKIYGLKVDTNVTNRFAITLVTSKVKNLAGVAQEASFAVVLPDTAYISGFAMEIDGKRYEAYVKEKDEAKKIYSEAVSSGQAAAHVAVNARDSNRFTVSVNIGPQSKAIFFLTYEELLQRQNGQYDIVINIQPGQLVKNLDVQVNINETRSLKFVKAPSMRTGNEISKNDEKLDPKAKIEIFNATAAKVHFNPDINRQKQLALDLGTKEENGLSGQFIVQYDVERDAQGGEMLVSDGYFVHFFAPSDLKPLNKRVVFVLDTSGSMWGIRIDQLKEAMKSILSQLNKGDTFNIVDFDSLIRVWDVPKAEIVYKEGEEAFAIFGVTTSTAKPAQILPGGFEVNDENIKQAQAVLGKLNADGGTNIEAAIKVGLQLIKKENLAEGKSRQPIIIFLTDGEATAGETNNDKILSKISEHNTREVPIFALSFGDGADRRFLEKLSLRNHGFARHIYEAADASLQLQAFYKYISSPLLSNVHFKYVSKSISKVTKIDFPILFDGSEIAVCGVRNSDGSLTPIDTGSVTGWGTNGAIELRPVISNSIGSLEKHWAYLTIKQILTDGEAADNNKTEYTKKALDIALKYSFVTPVTSLVVVKPNDSKSEIGTEDASKQDHGLGYGGTSASNYFMGPQQASTTPYPLIYTSKAPTIADPLAKLKIELPWLELHLTQNGTLQLPSGSFQLGIDATVAVLPECPQTPLNSTGTCTLLRDCEQVYPQLVDFQAYTKYFCPLNEYAGICCPKKTR